MEPESPAYGLTVSLLDHHVGTAHESRWHREAQRLSRLQVDREFIFGRQLDRQVTRLCTLDDLIHIGCRSTKEV